MDPNLAVVLVAIVGIIVPLLTTLTKYWQDKRIAAAAELQMTEAAEKADGKLQDAAHKLADKLQETESVTGAKLEQIHTLVNSSLTAALQAELESTVREVALLTHISRAGGVKKKPDPEITSAMEVATVRAAELRKTIAERRKQTEIANGHVQAVLANNPEATFPT